MRVADVDCQAGQPPAADGGSAGAQQVHPAHLDSDVGSIAVDPVHDDRPRAGQGSDHELVTAFQAAVP
jgi:hypothetical protein